MKQQIPRIVLAAPASGSGKTMITCGILQILKNKGFKVQAYKCGPDYIDPMFHKVVLDTPSNNLDVYLSAPAGMTRTAQPCEKQSDDTVNADESDNTLRYLFARAAEGKELAIIEGVMGYFDGLGGITSEASTADVAKKIDAPVVLIIDTKGMSVSLIPLIQGFLSYENPSHIKGIILNRMSSMLYPRMKAIIEEKLPVKVLGYVPEMKDFHMESRHLGLKMPQEIADIKQTMEQLGARLEETLDIEGMLSLADSANALPYEPVTFSKVADGIRIGIAKDEAFCFYYEDNLSLLREMGAELVEFSPIRDKHLPEHIAGIILGGGYPELYAAELEANSCMRHDMRRAIRNQKLPYLAECGGFLYLQESIQTADGHIYQMAGAIEGTAYSTSSSKRFGYIELTAQTSRIFGQFGASIRAHEFHYFDSTSNGDAFEARKPVTDRNYLCMHANEQGVAGFPHLYYYSNPDFPRLFLERCAKQPV